MKVFFFFILLVNIIFFFWEYRKGAPAIYYPPVTEATTFNAHKITLLKKVPKKQVILTGTNESNQTYPIVEPEEQGASTNIVVIAKSELNDSELVTPAIRQAVVINEFVGPLNKESNTILQQTMLLPLTVQPQPKEAQKACFQLQKLSDKQKILSHINKQQNYELSFSELNSPYISSYLVLTLPADSLQQALQQQADLKRQGISDLWLFRKGKFKWQISLGLFSSSEKATYAKEQYTQKISQPIIVSPSIQNRAVIQVTISAEQKETISSFEKQFLHYLNKQVDCVPLPQ